MFETAELCLKPSQSWEAFDFTALISGLEVQAGVVGCTGGDGASWE